MKAIAMAAAVYVGLGCLLCGGRPAGAAEGTKVFKQHCTLFLKSDIVRNGRSFTASDIGSGCGEYYLRSVGMVTTTGMHVSAGVSDFDANASESEETLSVMSLNTYADFVYGTVNVHIPYRARCDRYRLYASGEVRLVGSQRCSSERPGEKTFKKDCTLHMNALSVEDGTLMQASDDGSECGDYVLRSISVVTLTGEKSDVGLSDGDQQSSPDRELLQVTTSSFAFGTVNVYIPDQARCDRYRLYPDRTVRFTESHPCSSATS